LRGNHEDIKMNKIYGLGDECAIKLNENINDKNSVFQKLNKVFDYLPLAAIVEDSMLCVHGGIGKSIQRLE